MRPDSLDSARRRNWGAPLPDCFVGAFVDINIHYKGKETTMGTERRFEKLVDWGETHLLTAWAIICVSAWVVIIGLSVGAIWLLSVLFG